ncbi:MAG TPA: HyaD/HybD family hydrogenase maturation endopeptidase, partial [Gemmatimonadales bacterium]|nr:HyaD/HybD family hydrogenase maturation endopeptidase [Gemmatimonadales bacterium]
SDPMPRTLVLGLGNPLMGDDGLGLAALQRLREEYEIPEMVFLVDGGTWGMNLLPLVESAEDLVLVDAINTNAVPGTVIRLERDELPRYFAHKLSPHQIDLREVLALAEWRQTLPRDLVALGIQPLAVELGEGLSLPVANAMEDLVELVVEHLETRGHVCVRRAGPVHA